MKTKIKLVDKKIKVKHIYFNYKLINLKLFMLKFYKKMKTQHKIF